MELVHISLSNIVSARFIPDVLQYCPHNAQVETGDVRFTVRDTSSGKYQSVTLQAPVKSASMLYRCYELIHKVSFITRVP